MLYHRFLLPVLLLLLDTYEVRSGNQSARIACYFYRRAVHRPDLGRYAIENIPADMCTHLIYSFIGLNDTSWDVLILDSKYDEIENGLYNFTQLRRKHPHLKLQISVGEWSESGQKYSQMVALPDCRQTFIRSIIKFMKNYDFDGIDLNWVYPGDTLRDGAGEDKDNFLYFVQELRHAIDTERRHWEITMTAPLEADTIYNGYHVSDLCKLVDAVYAFTFNFHGPWEDFLDVQSPLHKRKHDKHAFEKFNVNDGLMLWEEKGCPASKLVLALTFYARTYRIDNSITSHSIGTIRNKYMGSGPPGPYTKSKGFLAYYEICTEIMAPWKGLEVGWDDDGLVPYAYNDTLWGGYENERSVQIKMNFLKEKGYAGVMAFDVTADDFHGLCGTKNILLKTIHDNMRNYSVPIEELPKTCSNGRVLPHPDRKKYFRCVEGKLVEFDCIVGTEFNAMLKAFKSVEYRDSYFVLRKGKNIFIVKNICKVTPYSDNAQTGYSGRAERQ